MPGLRPHQGTHPVAPYMQHAYDPTQWQPLLQQYQMPPFIAPGTVYNGHVWCGDCWVPLPMVPQTHMQPEMPQQAPSQPQRQPEEQWSPSWTDGGQARVKICVSLWACMCDWGKGARLMASIHHPLQLVSGEGVGAIQLMLMLCIAWLVG